MTPKVCVALFIVLSVLLSGALSLTCSDCTYTYNSILPDTLRCDVNIHSKRCSRNEVCYTKYTKKFLRVTVSIGCMNKLECAAQHSKNDRWCKRNDPSSTRTSCTFC
uniref:Uncharacterized protein LOC102802018 n=1 Tax=Saccoglossus kowalevskii TaxID=10224 RepID=A0ABM0MBJ4_SACKO|nr:PREDICTED: uncharacterized protein LOC102802018 [Saccoglossus kowalevskii]